MRKYIFLILGVATTIVACQNSNTVALPPDGSFYNSLWKMTIKSDTSDIVIDSVDFSSYYNNYTSPAAILFLNEFKRATILSKPVSFTVYNYIGGWLLNTNATLPYDFQLAFILQYADTPSNQLDLKVDTAYFKLNADSSIIYSTQIVHNRTILYGPTFHTMDSIRLNRKR